MPATYYAIFTTLGLQRLAEAAATYTPLVFYEMAVGDGDGSPVTPSASMTGLVNERARVSVNLVEVDPDNPNQVRVEGLIPAATGGFTIREAGVFNADGELIAVANYPPIAKPVPADGVSVEEYIRILLVYENPGDAIELSVDTSVVMATRHYVDEEIDDLRDYVDDQDEELAESIENIGRRIVRVEDFSAYDSSSSSITADGTFLQGSPLHVAITGTGAVTFGRSNVPPAPYAYLVPSTTSTHAVRLQSAKIVAPAGSHAGRFIFETHVALDVVGANSQSMFVGLFDVTGKYAGFFRDDSDANWQCNSSNGGSVTSDDSGVAVSAGVANKLRIEAFGANHALGARIRFYIDDVLVAEQTTNLVTSACRIRIGPANTGALGGSQGLKVSPVLWAFA